MVYIVGIGPGARNYILPEAEKVIESVNCVIGFDRALRSLDYIKNRKTKVKSLFEIIEFINMHKDKNICVVASGDPCFYGITDYINRNFTGDIRVIPGISSFQYMVSKLGKSWQNAGLYSIHGREEQLIEKVRENKVSIWLTDRRNSPEFISKKLLKENIRAKVYVGENLSYPNEKISSGTVEEMSRRSYADLCVVIIENGSDVK